MLDFGTSGAHNNAQHFGDLDVLDAPTSYTIIFKFVRRGTAAGWVWGKGNEAGGGNSGWAVNLTNTGRWTVRHKNGASSVDSPVLGVSGIGVDAAPISVAIVWNGTTLKLWLAGVLDDTESFSQSIGASATRHELGNFDLVGTPSQGGPARLGQVMFYKNFAMGEDEILTYEAGLLPPNTDKLNYWVRCAANPDTEQVSQTLGTNVGTVSLHSDPVDALFQGETYILQALEAQARRLRRNRFPMLAMQTQVGPEGVILEVGDPVNLASLGTPRAGSLIGTRETDQMLRSGQPALCFLGDVVFDPNTFNHGLTLEEAEHEICTFWSTFKLPFSVDENRDGLAQINHGAKKSFTRGTTAWLQQADGLIVRIGPGLEKMNHEGLWIEPSRKNLIKNSNWALTSISTNWTDNTGDGSAVANTTTPLFKDTVAYPRVLLVTRGTGNTLWTADAVAVLTADGKHRVQIWRQGGGSQVGSWRLQRSSDSFYWNDGSEAWQSGSVFNVMPTSATYAPHFSKPIDAPANTNWTLDIGVTSGIEGDAVFLGQVDIQNTRFACSPIVTAAAAYLQDADTLSYSIASDAQRQLVYAGRHAVRLTAKAQQNAGDLEDGDTLVLAYGQIGTTAGSYVALYYEKPGGSAARFVFEVKPPSAAAVKATFVVDIVRGTSYEIMGRLVDNSGYELGLAARTVSLLVNGVKGTDAVASVVLDVAEANTEFWPGSAPASLSWDSACFAVSDVDAVQRAIPDEEALALR